MTDDAPLLIVVPNVPAAGDDGDRLLLDSKAVEGLVRYAELWPGPVRAVFRRAELGTPAYFAWVERKALPFEVMTAPAGDTLDALVRSDRRRTIVLAGADDYRDLDVVTLAAPSPVVFTIEYTLKTRLDIVALSGLPRLKRWRSYLWNWMRERERRSAFRLAAGVQANGSPAFLAYAPLSPRPLLYFDTRLNEAMFIGIEQAAAKADRVLEGRPLRLAFSGRLEPMKGADHLLPVARALAEKGIAFTLDIYGDGSLGAGMRAEAEAAMLSGKVRFHGPVPFEGELVPTMKGAVDLLLCCHRQADPSCTYLETLGCGVPIAGYRNDAFLGVLALGDCGVGVGMDDHAALADAVAALDRDRDRLATLTRNAAAVSQAHLFEPVFARRIDHLRAVLADAVA
jgi:glycosyltransferase involved in cell wall biosynthesis